MLQIDGASRAYVQIHIYISTYLRSSLREPENVVYKEQHILSLLVPEVLCYGETSQSDASTSTRGFVHLPIDECHLQRIREELLEEQ